METTLKAEKRDGTGKGVARKLRAAGRVPGVLYGHGNDPIPLSVSGQDLIHLLHGAAGANVLVDLDIDGDARLVIPREIQRDYIHARFVHVDFLEVRRDEKITLVVEVHEVGASVGVHEGGVIEHHLREVEVECLPTNVPDRIDADITKLEIGDMLHVRDLITPEGAEILSDPDAAVISVITPAALRVEADLSVPGEEGAPAPEPEEELAAAEGEAPAEEAPAEGEAAPAEEGGEG
jgi:large subunit ribosomal protein L25